MRSPRSTAPVITAVASSMPAKSQGSWQSAASRNARAGSTVRYPRRTSVTATGSARPSSRTRLATSAYAYGSSLKAGSVVAWLPEALIPPTVGAGGDGIAPASRTQRDNGQMDLRELQAPLKERYRESPAEACITLTARASEQEN